MEVKCQQEVCQQGRHQQQSGGRAVCLCCATSSETVGTSGTRREVSDFCWLGWQDGMKSVAMSGGVQGQGSTPLSVAITSCAKRDIVPHFGSRSTSFANHNQNADLILKDVENDTSNTFWCSSENSGSRSPQKFFFATIGFFSYHSRSTIHLRKRISPFL